MEEKRDARGLTEAEAIARYRSRNYPKPALTADVVILARSDSGYQVLLIERGNHPYIGKLALPGGFANENESIEATAQRELFEETGISDVPMKLVGVFSQPGRDPRGWVVSAAYTAVVKAEELSVRAGDDAAAADWYQIDNRGRHLRLLLGTRVIHASELAFDHEQIILKALAAVEQK